MSYLKHFDQPVYRNSGFEVSQEDGCGTGGYRIVGPGGLWTCATVDAGNYCTDSWLCKSNFCDYGTGQCFGSAPIPNNSKVENQDHPGSFQCAPSIRTLSPDDPWLNFVGAEMLLPLAPDDRYYGQKPENVLCYYDKTGRNEPTRPYSAYAANDSVPTDTRYSLRYVGDTWNDDKRCDEFGCIHVITCWSNSPADCAFTYVPFPPNPSPPPSARISHRV